MIALKIQDKYIDLPDDATLSFSFENPMFSIDGIPGGFSYPFKAPASIDNNKIFGHFNLINTTHQQRFINDVELYILQVKYAVGTLNLISASADFYMLNFQTGAGDVKESFRDKSLIDFDFGNDELDLTAYLKRWPNVDYTLFPIFNPAFYTDKNEQYAGYINYFFNGEFARNSGSNQFAVTPFPYLFFVLTKLFEQAGYSWEGGLKDDMELKNTVFYNNYALDKLVNGLNVYENNILWTDHLPDVQAVDFLNSLKNLFGLNYTFKSDEKIVYIDFLKDIFLNDPVDWTEYISPAYTLAPSFKNGYSIEMSLDGNEQLTDLETTDFKKAQAGDASISINTNISTLIMRTAEDAVNMQSELLTPYTLQTGSSAEFELEINDFTMRLLIYRGVQKDSLLNDVPMGSSGAKDINGASIGEYSLYFNDAVNGLIPKFWDDWLAYITSKTAIKYTVFLPFQQLLAFDFRTPVTIQHLTQGQAQGFISSIDFSVSKTAGLSPVSITLIK